MTFSIGAVNLTISEPCCLIKYPVSLNLMISAVGRSVSQACGNKEKEEDVRILNH